MRIEKEYYVVIGPLGVAHYSTHPAYSNKYLYSGGFKKIRRRFKTKQDAINYLKNI